MLNYIIFILGFILLIKGADYLIKGAAAISKKYKIPEITIGLTVVALGTSLPEMVVNVFASMRGETDLILGNIAGSNIANIFLVLGAGAILAKLIFTKETIKIDTPFALGTIYLLLTLIFSYFFITNKLVLTRVHGIIFLLIFISYIYLIFKRKNEFVEEIPTINIKKAWIYTIIGAIGLFLGGEIVVNEAINIAKQLGLTTMFIGASIIALGTSLPELVTIIVSISKKKNDLAIGNIIGSNIFNVLLVLGVSAIITPLTFTKQSTYSFLFAAFSMILLMYFLINFNKKQRKYQLKKHHGLIFLALYIIYIITIFHF